MKKKLNSYVLKNSKILVGPTLWIALDDFVQCAVTCVSSYGDAVFDESQICNGLHNAQ